MTSKEIGVLDALELLDGELLLQLYDVENQADRARIRAMLLIRAKELGVRRDLQSVLNEYDREPRLIDAEYQHEESNLTDFSFQTDALDCGSWTADDKGVRRKKQSDGTMQWASPIPVLPTALLENINTGTEKVRLDFVKGKKRSLICERSVTAAASKIVTLADKGLEVTSENAKLLVQYISETISRNLETIPCYEAVSTLGWNQHGFAFGGGKEAFAVGADFGGGLNLKRTLYGSVGYAGVGFGIAYAEWLFQIHFTYGEVRKLQKCFDPRHAGGKAVLSALLRNPFRENAPRIASASVAGQKHFRILFVFDEVQRIYDAQSLIKFISHIISPST
jgi:hypothetical protein